MTNVNLLGTGSFVAMKMENALIEEFDAEIKKNICIRWTSCSR